VTVRQRLTFLSVLFCASCSGSVTVEEPELIVSTAVSLIQPLQAAIDSYTERLPDGDNLLIGVHAGGSSLLVQQILRGAPSDLFLSASPHEMERLVAAGLADEDATCTLAGNTLVVVVPVDGQEPNALHDLTDPRFEHVGVANPRTAPLGRYTRQALDALNLQARLANKLIPAEHARQVVDYVARGEVDAAVVYVTDARRFADRVSVALEIDPGLHERIVYQVAVLANASPADKALRLFEYLCSDAGRTWFVESGLTPWPGPR
jgi:molybdate transport system substrate-binding protein